MADPARKRATYDDILAAPQHLVAELVEGVLHTFPRPAKPHAMAASALGGELGPPFGRGRGGPGGWIILDEPEIHLSEDVVVPDLAGWRRERMPVLDASVPYFTLAPDWLCEILSPSTERFDRGEKLAVYARAHVEHVWLVNPPHKLLEVLRRDGECWLIAATFTGDGPVRAEPFDAIELDLSALWADVVYP